MKFDIERLASDPEYRARIMEAFEKRKAARVAAMSPDEREAYERERRLEEERDRWYGERSTLTNGEIARDRDQLEQALDEAEGERDAAKADADKTRGSLSHALDALGNMSATAAQAAKKTEYARKHQSEGDKKNAKLKAENAKLTEERDAARLAYLELLDKQAGQGKGGAK